MPIRGERTQIQRHWELLEQPGPGNPWHEVVDEFTGDPAEFQERHYNEFTTFLPYVQRFLYGEGRSRRGSDAGDADPGGSPMRVFRRDDIAAVRLTSRRRQRAVDAVDRARRPVLLLRHRHRAAERRGRGRGPARCSRREDTLYRFARAYPAAWEDDGDGLHCMHRVEWLAADGGGARSIRRRPAREVPDVRRPAPGAADFRALVVPAAAAGARARRTTKARSATGCSSTTACR